MYEEATWRHVIGRGNREWVPIEFKGWKGDRNGSSSPPTHELNKLRK
jgi:hypothetical protein